MSTIAAAPLPHWDLTDAFPSLDSDEFAKAFEHVRKQIANFDSNLAGAEVKSFEMSSELVESFVLLLGAFNNLTLEIRTLDAFISGYVTVDSRNELALCKESELETALVPFSKLTSRFTAWLGRLPVEALTKDCSEARDHRFVLNKAQVSAKHLMSAAEESLAAELESTALSSWAKLQSNVSSQIEVSVEIRGGRHEWPMSVVRNLAYDADREVRRSGYEAEQTTWKEHEVSLAACMNSIKSTVQTLSERRGWPSVLDESLFSASIERQTLDAMMEAAREAYPDYRRYLRAKAKLLKLPKLAFYDIFAPVSGTEKQWDFEDGAKFVAKNFDNFTAKLGNFARRSFDGGWIDAEPRAGKVGGAFCMFLVNDQSRILMNYRPSFSSVKTLSHELGHAYHNVCLAKRTSMQRRTPMTLAETASIFCETIVYNAAIENCEPGEQLLILEGSLQDSCQTVVDISSRFLFEQAVFERRKSRELTPSEMCSIMADAQKRTYGDALDEEMLHPYMWAAKPHYYSGRSFYNFPYMFGLLFALGLYSEYQKEPKGFQERYDELLSSTGMADAAELAQRFGFDIRRVSFWRSSLDVIRAQVDRFEKLAGA